MKPHETANVYIDRMIGFHTFPEITGICRYTHFFMIFDFYDLLVYLRECVNDQEPALSVVQLNRMSDSTLVAL